jgi:hypothetical protein
MSRPAPRPSDPLPLGRRRAAAVGLMLAPILTLAGAASWPTGSDGSTADELRAAAAQPALWGLASILDVLPWLLLLLGAIGVLGFLRGRGGVLGLIGAIGVAAGAFATCIVGGVNLLVVPVVAAQSDRAAAVRFMDSLTAQPTALPFILLIYVGLIGTILLTFGALRGGLVRWWVPVLLVVGAVVNTALNSDLYGLAAAATFVPFALAELLLGLALLRTTRLASPAVAATAQEPAPTVV